MGLCGNFTLGATTVSKKNLKEANFAKKKLRNRISTAKLSTASGRKYERLERIKGFNKTKLRRALLEFVNGSAAFRISLHSFTCFYKRR